jgi:outer membrane immunogenic protein
VKRLTSFSALLAAAMTGPALAADFDSAPEFRPSTFEVYVGTFGAVNTLNSSFSNADDVVGGNLDGTAFGLGFRLGADYIGNGWLLGAVADWSFGGGIAEDSLSGSDNDLPNLGTIRARAGYHMGSALLYVTGGYATAEFDYDISNADLDLDGSDSGWTSGWTLGGGLDLALTDSVSVGLEYLYIDLEDVSYDATESGDPIKIDQEFDGIHSIRLGLNYAFQI